MAVNAATTGEPSGRGSAPIADNIGARTGASWLLCRTGSHLHAIPIEHVIEIMRVLPIEAVSGAPRYVCGLCIIRGSPVPVVDLGLLVSDQSTRFERLITIRAGSRTVALAAEKVLGIQDVDLDRLGRLPPLLAEALIESIDAIGTFDSELLFVLRTARIIPEDFLDRLDISGASQ